jgi:hypothetical protein
MLLAFDSSLLEGSFQHQGARLPFASHRSVCQTELSLAPWLDGMRVLISKLRSHLDALADLQTQFSQAGDADGCLSLKCCIVIMLTHLALGYNLLGKHQMNTTAVDDQTSCADMVSHLAVITQELRAESSIRRVHMYTGVCIHTPLSSRLVTSDLIRYRCVG